MHLNSTTSVDDLAAECRARRERMEILRASHRVGQCSYDDLATAARAFCAAFEAYHKAKFGKVKRLDFRAVIR